jgi:hypothetical protein
VHLRIAEAGPSERCCEPPREVIGRNRLRDARRAGIQDVEVNARFGLADLIVGDPRRPDQDRSDHVRVQRHARVAKHLIGSPLYPCAEPRVAAAWLGDEHVRQFVPDQRLRPVVEIGQQDLGGRVAGPNGLVVLVDQFGDAQVGVEAEQGPAGIARADEALGAGERVDDRGAERAGERVADVS